MIKTLQKKFIFTAMTAITVLLIALLGAINILNAWTSANRIDRLLEELVWTESAPFIQDAQMPNSQIPEFQMPDSQMPGPQIQAPQKGDKDFRGRGGRGFLNPALTEDEKMAAVFFSVRTDTEGNIVLVDVSRISSVSEDDAISLVENICANGIVSGKTGNFKYTSTATPDGRGNVYIFMDTTSDTYSVFRVVILSLLAGIVCWGLMLLLVVVLSKKAIRPIAENIEWQKQFVTDAGHEIKTPLAIIQANTDAMELHTGKNKWSTNIREQILRLNGLMQDLLTLAKMDESKSPINTTNVSLSGAVTDTIRVFEEAMELKKLTLESDVPSDVTIQANQEQITRLLSILMDNAVKYSLPDSKVCLSVKQTDKAAILQIENTCEALPDCEPEKLFDRFYRADAARTQKNGGYGIGLSAAKAIVELHKGTISAKYENENRMIFTVKFV